MNIKSERNRKISYYLLYTVVFAVIMAVIMSTFILLDKSLVEDGGDGYRQRLRAMTFYSRYLRQILYTLIQEHRLVIPDWSFSIGQGGDILGTLQYFAEMGDPLATLCVFVPQKFLPLFYSSVVVIRLYLSGLFFSIFCRYKGYLNNYAVLAGSIIYVFCSWSFVNLARYPHWLFPLVYFPLVLLGIELVIEKKRPYLLTFSVMLCALSNFYYFSVVVILVVFYTAVRLIFVYKKDIKNIFVTVMQIGVFSGSGVLLAGITVFPMLYVFTNDSRTSVDYLVHLFFPRSYYSQLFANIITYVYKGEQIGTSIFGLLAVVLLFVCYRKTEKFMYKIFAFVFALMMIFPFFGAALNGFTYSINRWSWAFVFFEAFLLVDLWDDFMSITIKQIRSLFIILLLYGGLCFVCTYSRLISAFIALMLGIVGLFILVPIEGFFKKKELLFVCVIIVSVLCNSYFRVFDLEGKYIGGGLDNRTYRNDFLNNETSAIKNAAAVDGSDNLFRYGGEGMKYNAQLTADLSGTNYYWSISNPHTVELREELGLNDTYIFRYFSSDMRTILNTLEAVKYYAVNETSLKYPYGYSYVGTWDAKEEVVDEYATMMSEEMGVSELDQDMRLKIWQKENETYDVYRNDCYLPIVYSYDNYITKDEWLNLNYAQRQEAMLYGVVLEENPELIDMDSARTSSSIIPFEMENSAELYFTADNTIVTTAPNQTLKLKVSGGSAGENYLFIKGLDFIETNPKDLYSDNKAVDPENRYNRVGLQLMKTGEYVNYLKQAAYFVQPELTNIKVETSADYSTNIEYHTAEFDHYTDRHDFAINLGYSEEPVEEIKLTFEEVGTYKVDSLEVCCESLDNYPAAVNNLKAGGIHDIVMGTDSLSGKVDSDKNQMLCIAIPYLDGFTAYLDGNEVKLYNANVEYMGIEVPSGSHSFEIRYSTPFKKLGAIVSILAFLMYGLFVILNEMRIRRVEGKKLEN